ncbi:hypothetical protein LPICM17_110021 [Lactococcus piscium]|nr:hypothetical protein LPICM17_110021 [Lactococcus piscium]
MIWVLVAINCGVILSIQNNKKQLTYSRKEMIRCLMFLYQSGRRMPF